MIYFLCWFCSHMLKYCPRLLLLEPCSVTDCVRAGIVLSLVCSSLRKLGLKVLVSVWCLFTKLQGSPLPPACSLYPWFRVLWAMGQSHGNKKAQSIRPRKASNHSSSPRNSLMEPGWWELKKPRARRSLCGPLQHLPCLGNAHRYIPTPVSLIFHFVELYSPGRVRPNEILLNIYSISWNWYLQWGPKVWEQYKVLGVFREYFNHDTPITLLIQGNISENKGRFLARDSPPQSQDLSPTEHLCINRES